MTDTTSSAHSASEKANTGATSHPTPKFDMFVTGVATGVVVTTIVETGKGALGMLAKNPLVMLGAGIATGYFAHKYRKEIILSSQKVSEQSKDFVSRQKKNFHDMLSEIDQDT